MANSTFIANRIEKIYRRRATVVFPPVDIRSFTPSGEQAHDYYLAVGQFVPYKRIDLAVEVLSRMNKKLVVVGSGIEEQRLHKLAGPSIEFRKSVSDVGLAVLYQNCRALIFPGEEDFGIVPLEAMASGRPVIAYGSGGALDTVIDGVTGIMFQEQTHESLSEAIERFEELESEFKVAAIRRHAEQFSQDAFATRFESVLAEFRTSFDQGRMRQRPNRKLSLEPVVSG